MVINLAVQRDISHLRSLWEEAGTESAHALPQVTYANPSSSGKHVHPFTLDIISTGCLSSMWPSIYTTSAGICTEQLRLEPLVAGSDPSLRMNYVAGVAGTKMQGPSPLIHNAPHHLLIKHSPVGL